ncbi:MAG TPA: aminoacyl-histidine dipeptidase [Thermoplasmatales archaeon]|nr:aminoacyl-histidine dipeptidase [Thermoplasmatales archaeon]
MSSILEYEPKLVWKHFDEIRKIPRCSKHEEKIRQYLLNFAKEHGLEAKTDKIGNVLIKKPASKGMEKKPIVILQGHMDMVCEKNKEVKHDFSKDPIKLKIEGDHLTADGTTLGADDGVGVAIILAILEAKDIKHGPIEALFTVDEETGLTGAFALESGFLKGKIMINLDSEDFGVITVGCAGGGDTIITLPIKKQKIDQNKDIFSVRVYGLRGGHSGVDIHEQRGNAIKLLSRILWKAKEKCNILIFDITGGDKHNAIPREATAIVAVDEKDKNEFLKIVDNEAKDILEEIKPIDPGFKVETKESKEDKEFLDKKSTETVVNLLYGVPHGVLAMSFDIPDLVETSTNLAKVRVDGENITIAMSSRSSIKSALQATRDRIHAIASLAGAKVEEGEPYPGWKPNMQSKLLALARKVFKDMFKEEAKVEAIHAGLETGIIGEKFPGMDMISIGPTIKYPHSPDEYVEISSVEKFYKYVLKLLEEI